MVMCSLRKSVDALFTRSNPKFFIKAKSIEDAVVLIYGLKKNTGSGLAVTCELGKSWIRLVGSTPLKPDCKVRRQRQDSPVPLATFARRQ